jgi:hypothetical protein
MWDVGGQLCIKMCMIIANLMMHAKEHVDWQFKVLQVSPKSLEGTIYEMGI